VVIFLIIVAAGMRRGEPPPSAPNATLVVTARQPGDVGLILQPDDGRDPILAEIEAAKRTITLEIYLLSDQIIIAALEAASQRGIEVRVLLEEHPFGGAGGQPETFQRLQNAGLDIRWSNPAFRFSHIKTFVFDDEIAIIMNQNLTRSSFTGNRELDVITTYPPDVAEAAAIFEADWNRTQAPAPKTLVASPVNSRSEMLGLINGVTASLDLYAEVVRDPEMLQAVIAAAQRGVRVRLVMSGDPGDDNEAGRQTLAAGGVEVRLAPSRLYIHAKMILADGERLFIGSQNMTATSLDQNRELGIILDDPAIVRRAVRVFAQDFAASEPEK
jgi:phosphatidylserine/phosphatidylglycerophosphate/cardiolipin synthase-like enzyme